MKFIDEYRDADQVQSYAKAIAQVTTRPWRIMEICGKQGIQIWKLELGAAEHPDKKAEREAAERGE